MILKPCINCGNTDIIVKYTTTYGHGDSGYVNLRCECTDCTLAIGNKSGYGDPTEADKIEVMNKWNDLNNI